MFVVATLDDSYHTEQGKAAYLAGLGDLGAGS